MRIGWESRESSSKVVGGFATRDPHLFLYLWTGTLGPSFRLEGEEGIRE